MSDDIITANQYAYLDLLEKKTGQQTKGRMLPRR